MLRYAEVLLAAGRVPGGQVFMDTGYFFLVGGERRQRCQALLAQEPGTLGQRGGLRPRGSLLPAALR